MGLRQASISLLVTGVCVIARLTAQSTLPREPQYVGATKCGACHPSQFKLQSASGHAHALQRVADHPLADSFILDSRLFRKPRFHFRFSRDGGEIAVRVSDGRNTLTLPLQWAFGAGDQAVTFVSQVDEDSYIEHHFSYYSATRVLEATPGHTDTAAQTLLEAAGVLYKTFDPHPKIMRCFQCHSTGRLSLGPKFDLRPQELGVRCEVCHGPGSPHIEAVARGDIGAARKAILNPKRWRAEELNQFCGNCHRKPSSTGEPTDWSDPWNTRHQPLYLAQSRCFLKSKRSLSCLTCHDPHSRLRRNENAHYNGQCASCHSPEKHSPLQRVGGKRPDNCIGCHMPVVKLQAGLRFTNHWIGIYRKAERLQPVR